MDQAMDPFRVYFYMVRAALADNEITAEESAILKVARDKLGLSDSDHMDAKKILEQGTDLPGKEEPVAHDYALKVYEKAVTAALEDNQITKDEWSLLNVLRITLVVGDEEHSEILNRLKKPSLTDEEKEKLSKLKGFLNELYAKKSQVTTEL